jgi:hypothetical protein
MKIYRFNDTYYNVLQPHISVGLTPVVRGNVEHD